MEVHARMGVQVYVGLYPCKFLSKKGGLCLK